MSMLPFRSSIFRIHKWLGLHTAIFFIFMFATGTILVVSDELEAVFHPKIWAIAPADGNVASFGTIYDSVTRVMPQGQIFVIERQPQPWLGDRSFATTGWGEKVVVWTDPVDGTVLDVTKAANFRAFMHDLHDSLLVPRRIAFVLVASTSLILLTILIAGLITYRRFWRGLFRWPDKSSIGRARQGGLHRVLAVWGVVFLLISAGTSTFFIFTGLGMNGFVPEPAPVAARISALPAGFDGATIERAANVIHNVPGFHPTTFVLPATASDSLQFSGYSDDFGHFSGATSVVVDPTGMEILGVIDPAQFRGNARLKPLMNALHFGQWGEPISRILWFVLGILSIFLVIAGLKVAVLRRQSQDLENTGTSGKNLWQILGIFKWAYLGLALAIVAIGVLQFGPTSERWTTLRQTGDREPAIELQIFGKLRSGEPAKYRANAKTDQVASVSVQSGNQSDTSSQSESAAEITAIGAQLNNTFTVVIEWKNGEKALVEYELGAAIW